MIKQWLERRREQRKRADHERGYSYAAGELLHSGGREQERLDAEVEMSWYFSMHTEFDYGITHALHDWRKQNAPVRRFIP